MAHYLSLFVRAVFVENMALAFSSACVRSLQCPKSVDGIWAGYRGHRGAWLICTD